MTARCIETALRVLINLSHLSAEWCKLLIADPLLLPFLVREILSQRDWAVKKEEVDEVEDKDAVKDDPLDRQCLALALLSNVVLAIDDTKHLLRDTGRPCGPHSCCEMQCLYCVDSHQPILPRWTTLRNVMPMFHAPERH